MTRRHSTRSCSAAEPGNASSHGLGVAFLGTVRGPAPAEWWFHETRLDHTAIGQITDYSALLEQDWEPSTVSKLVVCTAADVPLRTACERQGIGVAVVHYEDGELVEDMCPLCAR